MDTLFRKSKSSRSSGSTPQPPLSAGLGGVPYNQLPQSNGPPVAGPSTHNLRRDTNGYENLKDHISSPTSNQGLGREGPPVPGKSRSSGYNTPAEGSHRSSSNASTYNDQRLVSPLPSGDYRQPYAVPRDSETASIRSVSTVSSLQNPNKDLGRYPSFSVDAQNRPIRPVQQAFTAVPGLGPSSTNESYNFPRPSDDEVEKMFARLIETRDFGSSAQLPTLSSRASVASTTSAAGAVSNLSTTMKWTLIDADARKQYDAKRKNDEAVKSGKARGEGVIVKNSPEWFLNKIMTKNFTKDHFNKLSVSLRTEPVG